MTIRMPITEGALRRAMRDERYWRPWHPERTAFSNWVTGGFQALGKGEPDGSGLVFVDSYTRKVNGKAVQVEAHYRRAPPGSDGDGKADAGRAPKGEDAHGGAQDDVATPVMGRGTRRNQPTPPPTPQRPRDADPGPPMERIPRQSGKENADRIPSWAERAPRGQNETPHQYADRIMRDRWGDGWR